MTFAQPYFLLFLLLLPVLAWLKGKVGFQPAFLYSSVQLVRGITGITRSRAGSFLLNLRWLALALFIIALARPQLGEGETKITASGIDIVIAIDLSGSMSSEDFQLQGQRVNRLMIAKDVLQKFIAKRPNDRIGLVAFATDAYIAAPLTLDHDFLLQNLDRLEIAAPGKDQTAIGSALAAGLNRLRELKSKSKIVILMTDGQNNAGKVPPLTAAEAAETLKVKVYTIASAPAAWPRFRTSTRSGAKATGSNQSISTRTRSPGLRSARAGNTIARTRRKRCVRFTTRLIGWRRPRSKSKNTSVTVNCSPGSLCRDLWCCCSKLS